MARLAISLLGPFQATLDGQPITGFKAAKVRALLAYLAVENGRPHPRSVLAALLWPDWADRAALGNLRFTLSTLRQAIGDDEATPPFLLITRDTIQLNPAGDIWLDIAAFERHIAASDWERACHEDNADARVAAIRHLEAAVGLCRGSFLEGFSVGDSPTFEEWARLQREQVDRRMLAALEALAGLYDAAGQYVDAERIARRQIVLDPWNEQAHRHLMRALALGGRRNAALAQYETCRRVLRTELGAEPEDETTALYEKIRERKEGAGGKRTPAHPRPGPLGTPRTASNPPLRSGLRPFLPLRVGEEGGRGDGEGSIPPFVAREGELGWLDRQLTRALAGAGRVVFVIGDAGSGKTALLNEFSRRALRRYTGVVVAGGKCDSYGGCGDPYLPFREILQALTGDIEAAGAGGVLTDEHAQRLRTVLPAATQALVETAPGLIDRFVAGEALTPRVEPASAPALGAGRPWSARLADRGQRLARPDAVAALLEQRDLFGQVTAFLRTLARGQPLILLLDDLQWADTGSISLLFHLGRHLVGSPILVVGAYRPEDITQGREAERHPLVTVVHELQRHFGDIELDLNQADGRSFMDGLLDSEPNRLGDDFRDMLYRHTEGHPLFTVELLQSLQARGDLVRDLAGRWVEGAALHWETVPSRIEAVIAERMDRLPADWRALLSAASVEGEEFTAEVVARVQGLEEREVIRRLSGALSHYHHLIQAHSQQRTNGQRLSRYRFRHHLFWQYLYRQLDELERAQLHEAVGLALEAVYGASEDHSAGLAPRLASHFEQAGGLDKAVGYWRRAGDQAMGLSACEDAIAHYMRGLALLATLPPSPQRVEQEVALQQAVSVPLTMTQGWGGAAMRDALSRAYALARTLRVRPHLISTLSNLSIAYSGGGELQKALELGEEILRLAQEDQDSVTLALGHSIVGEAQWLRGELQPSREHLELALKLIGSQPPGVLPFRAGVEMQVGCQSWLALVLLALGYPDRARRCSEAALARGEALHNPLTLAFALNTAGGLFRVLRREPEMVQTYGEALMRLATEKGLPVYQIWGSVFHGMAQMEQGQIEGGLAQISHAVALLQSLGIMAGSVMQLLMLAKAYRKVGLAADEMGVLEQALALVERVGLRYLEAEVWRRKGELLARIEEHDSAEACFRRAISIAQGCGARLWELRAAVSLARVWQAQGRGGEAGALLAPIYGWFTEGFETPDLREARALVEELR